MKKLINKTKENRDLRREEELNKIIKKYDLDESIINEMLDTFGNKIKLNSFIRFYIENSNFRNLNLDLKGILEIYNESKNTKSKIENIF